MKSMKPMMSTKFSALLLGAVFGLVGCSEYRKALKRDECAQLFRHIKTDWYLIPETNVYWMQGTGDYDIEKALLLHHECLVGLSRSHITKLFGEPSVVRDGKLYYLMTTACRGGQGLSSSGCMYRYFEFTSGGGMKVSGQVSVSVSH